jgi:uncharacterized SAM-binding protein YcdF (DUF218 family)
VTTNYLIWAFLKPSQLLVWLALVGILFRSRPIGRRCLGMMALTLLVFGLLPTAHWLIAPLERRFDLPGPIERVDGIIVLAGSELAGLSRIYGQPQLNSMGDRITTALMLAETYPQARLVHTGQRETHAARRLLLDAGIPAERIVFEAEARNTCENASRVRALVEPRPASTWLLVTSAFHLPRAVACFEAQDWRVVPYPADFRTGTSAINLDLVENLENLDYAAHEWLGLAWYRITGRTRSFLPGPGTLD